MDKITTASLTELAATGMRLRAQHLLQQAGYTLGIARGEGSKLEALLAPAFLDLVSKARDELAAALQDRTVLAAESKLATGAQNSLIRQAKEWCRRAISRGKGVTRAGAPVPSDLGHFNAVRSLPDLLGQMDRLISLLTEHATTMDAFGAPTQPLIDAGSKLRAALASADSAQELTRSSALPDALMAFHAKKGELHVGLKIVNDAGHELHAGDPLASSRYNLSILYRHRGASQAEQPPEPAPVTPPGPTPSTGSSAFKPS